MPSRSAVLLLTAVLAGAASSTLRAQAVADPPPFLAFDAPPDQPATAPATAPAAATAPGAPTTARATDDTGHPWLLTAYWENDSHGFRPAGFTDRHYTNGMKITLAHQPEWAEDLADYVPFGEPFAGGPTAAGYGLGQDLYTPTNLAASIPDPHDWPYAGYLYGSLYWQRATPLGPADQIAMMDYIDLDLGIVGPAAQGGGLQEWWHHIVDSTNPQGWAYQLHDEFGFDFTFQRHWRIPLFELGDVQGQLIPRAGFTAGTFHRQGDADVTFRIGRFLPEDFGAGRIEEPVAATGLSTPEHTYVYGFIRAGGQAVQHDIFIQGNTLGVSPSLDAKPVVGVVQMGISWAVGKHLETSWSMTYMTKEFDGQSGADSFGAWVVTVHFEF